jgi:hypothetical protein
MAHFKMDSSTEPVRRRYLRKIEKRMATLR